MLKSLVDAPPKSRKRRSNKNKPVVERVWGNNLFLTSTNAGASPQRVIGLHPRNLQDDRLLMQADIYETYRIEKITIEFLGNPGDGLVVAYRPGTTVDATPINVEQVSTMDCVAKTWPDQTVPTALVLNRAELRGEKDFYGTTDTSDLPGAIFVSSFSSAGATTAADVQLFIRYEYGFYGRVDPSITRARIIADLGSSIRTTEVVLIDDSSSDGDEVAAARLVLRNRYLKKAS